MGAKRLVLYGSRQAEGEVVTAMAVKNAKPRRFRRRRREKTDERVSDSSNPTVKCYDCGVAGHKRPDCLKKEENQSPEKTR